MGAETLNFKTLVSRNGPQYQGFPEPFQPWQGTLIRNEGDGYRGGPPGGPYGSGGPPSSHPLEPFGYYHSQLLARPVPNSQVDPRVGINTVGYNPKPGEIYQPHMPDFYSVPAPVIPVRPGVYPSPVSYEGYYGPSLMSFCNSNEQDTPNTGTVPPHVYKRIPTQNACPDTGKFPTRAISFGSDPAMAKEQMDPDQFPDDYRGPYKGFQKQQDGWGENDFDDSPVASMHYSEKGSSPRKPMREKGWEVDHRKNDSDDISQSVIGKESPSQSLCKQQGQILVDPINLPGRKTNVAEESPLKKPQPLANPSEGLQHISVIKKDAAVIDKIEGFNIKARVSDGRTEDRPTREEKIK